MSWASSMPAFGLWLLILRCSIRPSSRGALLLCTNPLLRLIATAALGFEETTPRRLAGALCALLSVLLALSDRPLAGIAQSFFNFGERAGAAEI